MGTQRMNMGLYKDYQRWGYPSHDGENLNQMNQTLISTGSNQLAVAGIGDKATLRAATGECHQLDSNHLPRINRPNED